MWSLQRLSHPWLLWFSLQSFEISRSGVFIPISQMGIKQFQWVQMSCPKSEGYRMGREIADPGALFPVVSLHWWIIGSWPPKPLHFLSRDISFQQLGWKTWLYGNEPHLPWSLELAGRQQLLQHGTPLSSCETWIPTRGQPRSSCDLFVPSERKSSRQARWKEGGGTDLISRSGGTTSVGSDLLGLKAPGEMLHLLVETFTAGRRRDRPLKEPRKMRF